MNSSFGLMSWLQSQVPGKKPRKVRLELLREGFKEVAQGIS